ncbi:MAG: RNA polymerase sigma factor [Actinomycetota bacterium]
MPGDSGVEPRDPTRSEPTRPSEADLRRVVERHAGAVYRLALTIVHDPALADDVVQETMLKAWRKAPVDPNQEIPRAWLMKVARNTAISLLRTRREDLHGPDTLPETELGIETTRTVEGRAQFDELRDAMRHLDEDARTLIVLKEVDGLSYDEIAETLDLPLPTVKTRLFRARRALKDALKEWR